MLEKQKQKFVLADVTVGLLDNENSGVSTSETHIHSHTLTNTLINTLTNTHKHTHTRAHTHTHTLIHTHIHTHKDLPPAPAESVACQKVSLCYCDVTERILCSSTASCYVTIPYTSRIIQATHVHNQDSA